MSYKISNKIVPSIFVILTLYGLSSVLYAISLSIFNSISLSEPISLIPSLYYVKLVIIDFYTSIPVLFCIAGNLLYLPTKQKASPIVFFILLGIALISNTTDINSYLPVASSSAIAAFCTTILFHLITKTSLYSASS